jgi:hypothetical protein
MRLYTPLDCLCEGHGTIRFQNKSLPCLDHYYMRDLDLRQAQLNLIYHNFISFVLVLRPRYEEEEVEALIDILTNRSELIEVRLNAVKTITQFALTNRLS